MPPKISVVIPCRNEEKTIALLLDALSQQDYPLEDLEIIISDGMSQDGTRQVIAGFQLSHPEMRIRIVDNPQRNIPAAMNTGIRASTGEIIVRMDAHSLPRPDYIRRCVEALEAGLADNVGGVWDIVPGAEGWIARAIAVAASHPLGAGDARYRFTNQASYVETVPFGAFQRSLIEKVGFYDETLLTNEDYELNTRIRQSGGRIWLDPQIRSTYFARKTLKELAAQYWRYGFWKAQMLRRYPDTLRLRQAIPPLFVLSLLVFGVLGVFFTLFRYLFLAEVLLYCLVLLIVGIQLAIKIKDFGLIPGVPLAVAAMHTAWGTSLLAGLIFHPEQKQGQEH